MKTIESILKDKKTILAVVAHPDDFEDYFPGTFMYAVENGLTKPEHWHIVVCTDGGKGSRDKHMDSDKLVKQRVEEQKASLKKLGIPFENYTHLDFEDGYITNHQNGLIERIAWCIRKTKPDLILTHNCLEKIVKRNGGHYYIHKDHRIVSQATLDAMYPYSRDLLFFPHHHKEGYDGHFVREVLLAETGEPDVKVDITDYIEKKIELVKLFASQIDSDKFIRDYFDTTEKENDGKYYESFRHVKLVI